ncbi:MAG TPA: hypothetical protein VFN63_10455 [Pseudolabrys sp.]|nr:hypothetical protein [Pseudolabrys sp.]
MGTRQALKFRRTDLAGQRALAWTFACALVLASALAFAQDATSSDEKRDEGFFASVGRWFSQQSANVNSTFKDARQKVEGLGQEAGAAAKSTVEGAKDAAGAVARIPNARAVTGHEKCELAPNGAPDCVAAANMLCKTKGFDSGRSLDMTTAEICPPKVWMAGRSTGPECRTETFVSRAVCQ